MVHSYCRKVIRIYASLEMASDVRMSDQFVERLLDWPDREIPREKRREVLTVNHYRFYFRIRTKLRERSSRWKFEIYCQCPREKMAEYRPFFLV